MPNTFMKLGEIPRKRHIKLPRENGKSFRGEGIAYEHVVTTAGFDRAYSITYHLRPPTRVKKVELVGHVEIPLAENLPLRHHHFKTFEMQRAGDVVRGRVPMLTNPDLTAWLVATGAIPAKPSSPLSLTGNFPWKVLAMFFPWG